MRRNIDLFLARSSAIAAENTEGLQIELNDGEKITSLAFEYILNANVTFKIQLRYNDGINWLNWNDVSQSDANVTVLIVGVFATTPQAFVTYNITHQGWALENMTRIQIRIVIDSYVAQTFNIINATGVVSDN